VYFSLPVSVIETSVGHDNDFQDFEINWQIESPGQINIIHLAK